VNGPERTVPGSARRAGYLAGLAACDLARNADSIAVASDFTIEAGHAATERLLGRTRVDAIFCANDLLAIGALAALRAANLDVPADVAVIGMDNTDLAAVTSPPLTTVDIGSAERARLAAELLLARIERPTRRVRTLEVEPTLVVRESCGAAA
jgi:LacI family transcriptional regulator